MLTAEIGAAHPDIELGVRRGALEYLVCAPDAGIDRDTGLALFVAGYGMIPAAATRRACSVISPTGTIASPRR